VLWRLAPERAVLCRLVPERAVLWRLVPERAVLLRLALERAVLLRAVLGRLDPLPDELDPLLDAFAFWVPVLPRVVCRLPLLADLLDAPRLLDRLEARRPLVAVMVHLLLFDSHCSDERAGAGLAWLYPGLQPITTFPGRMFDPASSLVLDV
jgi:hypothetical protein